MKSKIKTNLKLKKGIALVLLIATVLSNISIPVFAMEMQNQVVGEIIPDEENENQGKTEIVPEGEEEDDSEDSDSNEIIIDSAVDDEVKSAEEIEYEVKRKEVEELLKKIESLDNSIQVKFMNFCEKMIATEYPVINISNELDLRFLSIYVNAGNSCKNVIFNITNDIRLTSSIEWEPIGNNAIPFYGTINGNGFTISGISIKTKRSYAGLIGYLGNGSIVKNVVIADSNIEILADIEGIENDLISATTTKYAYVGAIAGYAKGATIINCINKGNVDGGNYVGGIVGCAVNGTKESIIKDCINTGIIRGYYCVGGIVGEFIGNRDEENKYSKIMNCVNKGKVFAMYSNAGGIAGGLHDYAIIDYCLNQANVSVNKNQLEVNVLGTIEKLNPQNVGGIVGIINGHGTEHKNEKSKEYIKNETYITRCINDENTSIYGFKDVGGLVGQLGGSSGGHAVAYNSINYSSDVTCTYETTVKYVGLVAGNVGGKSVKNQDGEEIYQGGRIYNCYYYGENNNFNSTYLQKQGAVGKFNGSVNAVRGNIAFKITKDGSKYIWQGRYYNIEDYNSFKKTGFVLDSTTNTWRYAYLDSSKAGFYPTTENPEVVLEGYHPTYSNSEGFELSSQKGESYQPWLYKVEKYFDFDSNGKAYIDRTQPSIKNIVLTTESGNSIVSVGERIFANVRFTEGIHNNGRIPSLKIKIGENEYNTEFVGIQNDTVIFGYIINGTENGDIQGISISNNNMYDVYNNKANVNAAGKEVLGNITILGNSSQSFKKQNKDELGENTWAVAYEIIGGRVIDGIRYFNSKDKITITAVIDKEITNDISLIERPSVIIKVGNAEQEIKFDEVTDSVNKNSGKTILVYNAKEINSDNGELKEIYLKTTTNVTVGSTGIITKLNIDNTGTNVSGIIVDKIAPLPDSIEASSKTYYVEGEKIIIDATFSEGIDENNIPTMAIKFGENVGKNNNGNIEYAAKYTDKEGRTVVKYEYTVVSGDNGEISVVLNGTIEDKAGNSTILENQNYTFKDKKYADTLAPTVEITTDGTNPTNAETIKYTFKFSEPVYGFTVEDITVNNGTKGKFSEVEDKEGLEYTLEVKPIHSIGSEGFVQVIVEENVCQDIVGKNNIRNEKIITLDKIAPMVTITADKEQVNKGETIKYTFTWNEVVSGFTAEDIIVNNGVIATEEVQIEGTEETEEKVKFTEVREGLEYALEVIADNGNDISVSVAEGVCTDIAGNSNMKSVENYVITVLPTLTITTDVSNPTNSSEITYTFEWSKDVEGFDEYDIILPNGVTGILSEDKTTMVVNYSGIIPLGNMGEVTVAVKEGAVKDSKGNINSYVSNTTKIDRVDPIFIGLEAVANNSKEAYKVGDTVTIVATFSENIEKSEVPTLTLQFSESGNAKGEVSEGAILGSKITYTYTISKEDEGQLNVKGFTGKVIDIAGNETVVTRRNLNGDTIIADTTNAKLDKIIVVAPDFEYDELLKDNETKRYGIKSKTRANNTILIIAEYSENVYSSSLEKITSSEEAPELKIKFGGNAAKGTVRFEKSEGNQIFYTYDITQDDNGNLSITGLNGKVYDISGNECTTSTNLPELVKYEENLAEENIISVITADTSKSTITLSATAVNYDDNSNVINGNGNYHRKGSVITITAKSDEYLYKNSNKSIQKFTTSNAPVLNIRFATNGTGIGTCTNVEYKVENGKNRTIFTYTYTVKENDNGILNLNIAELAGYDIALNGNAIAEQEIDTIIADTQRPYYEDQPGIEYIGSGYIVVFNEKLYYLDNDNKVQAFGNKDNAPKLKFEGMDIEYEPTVLDNKITYSGEYINSKPYLGASRLSDRAGNLYAYYDRVAPTVSNIKVTTPATGTYKAGETITIVATFSEKVQGVAPILTLKFGDQDAKGTVSQGIIEDNIITYIYTITNGDNGILSIKSFEGTGLEDLSDNKWVAPETVPSLTENRITADTEASILVIEASAEQTNEDTVTYTFTWNEKVIGFNKNDIEVSNGSKGEFKQVDSEGKVYTLEVDTIGEGRQIVKVASGVCQDAAGNQYADRITYNNVVIDYTKPTLRATVNGGKFVIATATNKSVVRETLVVNEELSEFKYIWSTSTTIPQTGWETVEIENIKVNSDISLSAELIEGTYYLYIEATDLAGNTLTTRTNAFKVMDSAITITPDKIVATNEDITVTISYGEGLTENRKAGISGKTMSADSGKVIISENGTIYAEATDKAGNKVYENLEINNIDKVAPVANIEEIPNEDGSITVKISFNEENVTITNNNGSAEHKFNANGEFTFTFKDAAGNEGTAVAKVTSFVVRDEEAPIITFNYTLSSVTVGEPIGATILTNEEAKISYSWDNENWTETEEFVTSVNATYEPIVAKTYTLYAKATDKTGNESEVETLEFKVIEEIKLPEIIFEDLPVVQIDGVKYVKVPANMTTETLTSKMNVEALCGVTPEYTKLTQDGKLRTEAEITIDGVTKYIVVVNGDVNCDGKITFTDIIKTNAIRISEGENTLSKAQLLAADINNTNKIEFRDIISINALRINSAN